MKDKDFDSSENFICHLIDCAGTCVDPDSAKFKLYAAQIHATLLLARVIQERPDRKE
jgi:hypothetical protein